MVELYKNNKKQYLLQKRFYDIVLAWIIAANSNRGQTM